MRSVLFSLPLDGVLGYATPSSTQHFRNRLDARINERNGARAHVIFLLGIDADSAQNRGEDPACVHFAFRHGFSQLVRFAKDCAGLNTAAKPRRAPSSCKVIAA